jgi:primase-polymerase (primpol)-like protein
MGLVTKNPPNVGPPLDFDAIPHELRALPDCWAYWKHVPRPGSNKPAKKPFDALTDKVAKVNEPGRWSDFPHAVRAVSRVQANGIGMNLREPYVGIDLDNCRDLETGEIAPWALDILRLLDSYTEVSPSGKGLRVICRGSLPAGRRRRGPVEMYDRQRYVTMTGRMLPGTEPNIHHRDEQLAVAHEMYVAADALAGTPGGSHTHRPTSSSGIQPCGKTVGLHPFTPFSLSGASQTPMRARGRFILLTAGEVGGHTPK